MAEVPITYEGFTSPFLEDRYDRFGAPIVQDIDETTMDALIEMVNEGLRRGYSPLQIANGVEEEDFDGVASIFDDDARSEMIARTETMFALNWGSGSSFADSGVSHVEALDSGDDPECVARNGQIYEIDPDTGVVVDDTGEPVKDHPNGTLAFAPYITDDVVAGGALDDTGDVVSFEDELGATYEVKHGTGQTNNPRGGNQHGSGAKVPRKHSHRNGVTHRHIGGARPHAHGSRVIPADSPAYRKEAPHGGPLTEAKYSEDQPRDERGRFGESGAQAFDSPAAGKNFLQAHFARWRASLTSAQERAVTIYQSPLYSVINGMLRGEKVNASAEERQLAKTTIDHLQEAIDKAPPLERSLTVYRDMSAAQIQGDEIKDPGFVSVAVVASDEAVPKGMVSAEITLPAGTRAAAGSSRELILPPDSTFKVVSSSGQNVRLELRKWATVDDMKYSDDQPRGDDGRWSAEGGGGGDVAGAVTAGAAQGGFSVHPYRGSSPKTGYQVAIKGRTQHFSEAVLHDTNALTKAILEHREANKDLYRAGGKMYLGGWTHEGKLWLEPSERVGSRAEAVKLGSDRNQIAIWDNAKSAEISTGGSGG